MKPRLGLTAAVISCGLVTTAAQQQGNDQTFKFRTGVELINVAATVTDRSGRFVSGLRREDFRIYEDGAEQSITHFSNERVPVSLGIALDTSSSMEGQKMTAARRALDRFLTDLLARDDQVFIYTFATHPELLQGWTTDRRRLRAELELVEPGGNTALYDAVAEAVPMAQDGRHRKKALVVISDGNDTASLTDIRSVKQLIRETEVLVYAIGIDGRGVSTTSGGTQPPVWTPPRFPIPIPFPFPGRRTPPSQPPRVPQGPSSGGSRSSSRDERVNVAALRDLTDDSGGRTEIVRSADDLDPATAGIADELSRQYYLGYPAGARKDGAWHSIRVEVRNPEYRIRARRGYVASAN